MYTGAYSDQWATSRDASTRVAYPKDGRTGAKITHVAIAVEQVKWYMLSETI